MIVLTVLKSTVFLVLEAVQLCMFITAILSWFPPSGEEGPIRRFLYTVTEFFVSPVRRFMERFEFARRSPIDLSFLITFILLSILSSIFA